MSWELGGQLLVRTEKGQYLKHCLYPFLGYYPYPGRPQISSLDQYLGGNLLGLPQEQEELDLLQGLQILGLVALGVQETQSRLTEEFSVITRDYCDITWSKALDAAGVPADSSLRRPESIYYDSDIQALPGSDSPPPEQPALVSEVPAANQALPAPVEVPTDSHQDAGQGDRKSVV